MLMVEFAPVAVAKLQLWGANSLAFFCDQTTDPSVAEEIHSNAGVSTKLFP